MPRPSQKDQILAAARRLFSEKGYHGTTIREIAVEAGVLSGSLYAHIESKEDLLFEIADEGAEAFLHAARAVESKWKNPVDRLREGLRAHIRVVADKQESAKVFFHEWRALSDDRRDVIQAKRDRYEAHWRRWIEEGMVQGSVRNADPKFVRLCLLSVANWVYQWYRPGGDLTPEDIADHFWKLLFVGIGTEAGTACELLGEV